MYICRWMNLMSSIRLLQDRGLDDGKLSTITSIQKPSNNTRHKNKIHYSEYNYQFLKYYKHMICKLN